MPSRPFIKGERNWRCFAAAASGLPLFGRSSQPLPDIVNIKWIENVHIAHRELLPAVVQDRAGGNLLDFQPLKMLKSLDEIREKCAGGLDGFLAAGRHTLS